MIENPASVIKELMENALDAGANHLTIEIKGGGFQLIRVSDDGSGMSRDDAVLCFERHATSKISDIDDLATLRSMGFRGEALASIAAIAKISLITAEKEGTLVEIEGGKIQLVTPASRKQGTTFEIRSLFYNVPARKKFQKQPSAASTEIHKLIVTMALAHPEIGFELISNEKSIVKVAPAIGATFLDRLKARMADFFEESFQLQLQKEKNGYQLQGFLGMPADDRQNRTGQYLFVNRRPIFSPQVAYAVKEGYGQRLNEDRYPVFVLHLSLPSHLLDVNVHPQKREVRFQEGEFLRQYIKESVQGVFGPSAPIFSPRVETFDMACWESKLLLREEPTAPTPLMETEHVIGLFNHYLLLDGSTIAGYEQGIVWVDLIKAQAQLIWQNLNKQTPEIVSQGLLLPLTIELSGIEMQELSNLEKFGFVLQCSGKQTVLVEAIPPFLEESDASEAIRLVLQSEEPFPKLSRKIAGFALRRKKRFMLQEALALWRAVRTLGLLDGITFTGIHEIEGFFK